jgi:hypothetical protein
MIVWLDTVRIEAQPILAFRPIFGLDGSDSSSLDKHDPSRALVLSALC